LEKFTKSSEIHADQRTTEKEKEKSSNKQLRNEVLKNRETSLEPCETARARGIPRMVMACLEKWASRSNRVEKADEEIRGSREDDDDKSRAKVSSGEAEAREQEVGKVLRGAGAGIRLRVASVFAEPIAEKVKAKIEMMQGTKEPFAVLVKTDQLHLIQDTVTNLEQMQEMATLSYIHVLWPFKIQDQGQSALGTWVCRGVDIPEGEVFAESSSIFLVDRKNERGFYVGSRGAKRQMSQMRMIRALAAEISSLAQEERKRKRERAKQRKIELVRFLKTAPVGDQDSEWKMNLEKNVALTQERAGAHYRSSIFTHRCF
jgi:hypothetical protein